jgi:DeoR family transcriptional regulator, glycerol-3-phosphate regulon repressor
MQSGDCVASLNQRQQTILELARSSGRVTVDELSDRFVVSVQTIRKDLNEMCDRRLMTRVHGGAIISSGVENLGYEARRLVNQSEKAAIGAAAADLIPNNCSLFVNIGTTTEEFARALGNHSGLLVITNNLNVATLLYPHPLIEVIVAGGPVRRADGAVVGQTAVDFIKQFKVDYAVVGASAIDPQGTLLDFDYREVRVSRAIIENARQIILVSDAMKFQRTAPVRIGHLEDIDVFVTDRLPTTEMVEICRANDVRVIEVGSESED